MSAPTESAVLALVPQAEPVVGKERLALDPTTAAGVPAHVTVLYPFLPPDEIDDAVVARLQHAVAGSGAIDCSFATTGWFGEDYLWLGPRPSAPFADLTACVWEAFPQCPPYRGEHEPHPHLTIGYGSTSGVEALRAAEARIVGQLPFAARVEALHLLVGSREPDSWRVVADLPLTGER
ncbi:2'-5' RNA ligase family protein [Actinomycetospora termitidis]|uniref:2'-5' RNA ligase family protein n=1 Tax=Actinomycetospora termitidis TaxID=3053470 RepID=A0ABT7M3N9_9PSEU|nr:2'-5' RNA ligase family protein [Actinomycetospora sp. Odt1-22]MDL5155286.1 2'-5' RNA ligase family protein [Actinomycetospora sp. Odt1-22]